VTACLGRIDGRRAIELVEQGCLDVGQRHGGFNGYALREIGGERANAIVKECLGSPVAEVRKDAVFRLPTAVGPERAFPLLERMNRDPDQQTRLNAYESCIDIVRYRPAFSDRLFVLLEAGLADESAWTRQQAAQGLGAIQDARARSRVRRALADRDVGIRVGAAEALDSVKEDREDLFRLALADPTSSVRRAATQSLRSHDMKFALPYLDRSLADPDADVRAEAVTSVIWGHPDLYRTDGEPGLARILKFRDAPEKVVRQAVAQALWWLAESTHYDRTQKPGSTLNDRMLPALTALAGDREEEVRWQAIKALAELDDARACALLIKRLRREPAKDNREGIVRELKRAYGRRPEVLEVLRNETPWTHDRPPTDATF
jgi:HEAT repeat protein